MVFIVLVCTFPNSYAIDSLQLAKSYKQKAKSHLMNNEIYAAQYYLTAYIDIENDDVKETYRLAKLYYQTRDYENAQRYFDSVIYKRERRFELAYYYHGVVSMNLEDYNTAIESFDVFRRLYRGKRDPDNLRRNARNLMDAASWALGQKDSTADVTLQLLKGDVNGPHIEFSPFPIDKETLIYGSLKDDSAKQVGYRKTYIAAKEGDLWNTKGLFDAPVNHPSKHSGNAVVSHDGKRVYFTLCEPNWQYKMVCEIYMSEKVDGQWQEPVKLPHEVNDGNYTTTQPALGINSRKGNDIIYFVSDRPGTRGGLDIWYTEYDTRRNNYREPRNLGRNINSYGDECCPFYNLQNGTLYFSSNGRNGFGGFDIYRATGAVRSWTEAEALPKPINSSFDDTYFSTLNGSEGFFTSNRPGSKEMENGGCCDDVFTFEYNECVSLPSKGSVFNITDKDVYDLLTNRYGQDLEHLYDQKALSGIPVKVYRVDEDKEDQILVNQTFTNKDGEYDLVLERNRNYRIVIENYGYFDKRINISTSGYNCDEVVEIEPTGVNYLPEITVRFNIYYEHNKFRLSGNAQEEIDTLLLPLFDLYPNALVEIGSHTDNTGSENYNEKLSQKRSESVVKYLIRQGISEDRLVARGYGESQPIAPNSLPDGSDNPEGRQKNRRTEFKILGSLNAFNNESDDD